MILGNVCTRPCGFCSVPQGRRRTRWRTTSRPASPRRRTGWGCKHVVITSVTRDDLPDGGADHFRRCVLAVRAAHRGRRRGADARFPRRPGRHRHACCRAGPEVYNHNMETVPRLYKKVRGRADYQRSLDLLAHVKRQLAGDRDQERPDARPGRDDRGTARRAGRPAGGRLRHADAGPVPGADAEAHSGGPLSCRRRSSTSWRRWPGRWASARSSRGPFVRSSYHADEMVAEPSSRAAPLVILLAGRHRRHRQIDPVPAARRLAARPRVRRRRLRRSRRHAARRPAARDCPRGQRRDVSGMRSAAVHGQPGRAGRRGHPARAGRAARSSLSDRFCSPTSSTRATRAAWTRSSCGRSACSPPAAWSRT